MPTVSLYLDSRACGEGQEAPIKISINHKSASALIPTGVKVLPDLWDKKKKEVKASHPSRRQYNMFLTGKKLQIESILLGLDGKNLSASQLKEKVLDEIDPDRKAEKDKETLFLFRLRHYMSLVKKDSTRAFYGRTLTRIIEFDGNAERLTFEDIDRDFLRRFEAFCAKKEKQNTINIHLRNIRAVFNDAIDADITSFYPFRKYQIKPVPVKKKALTIDELRNLFAFDCEEYQKEYRDMFLLMIMLRGVNAGDLFLATDKSVSHGRFEYRRRKVGTLFSVKLEPEAMDIIARYKGAEHLLNPLDRYKTYSDYLHHMNNALKEIGRPLGKRRSIQGKGMFPELSTNWARHTWATIASSLDIPKDIISRGLGHSFGVAVTEIYIDFDMNKVDEANRKVIDFILYGKR